MRSSIGNSRKVVERFGNVWKNAETSFNSRLSTFNKRNSGFKSIFLKSLPLALDLSHGLPDLNPASLNSISIHWISVKFSEIHWNELHFIAVDLTGLQPVALCCCRPSWVAVPGGQFPDCPDTVRTLPFVYQLSGHLHTQVCRLPTSSAPKTRPSLSRPFFELFSY